MSVAFDPSDLFRFAPVAYRQASLKCFILEKEGISWKRRFFALFGNLLYRFEAEDPSSLSGIEFLEYSTVKHSPTAIEGQYALSISTVGGKAMTLSFPSTEDRQAWMEGIENCKFISLSRRLEDSEAVSVQQTHRVEQQERQANDLERIVIETDKVLGDLKGELGRREQELLEMRAEVS